MGNLALLGSWSEKWISDHKKWLSEYGPHYDGWSNTISAEKLELIHKCLDRQGFIWFYAYMSKRNSENMKVCYRLKIDQFKYSKEAQNFEHSSNNNRLECHDPDKKSYQARLVFRIVDIEDIEHTSVTNFFDFSGNRVKGGSQLLNVLVVFDYMNENSQEEEGEEQLALLIKEAGAAARECWRETMDRHSEKLKTVIAEAASRQKTMERHD